MQVLSLRDSRLAPGDFVAIQPSAASLALLRAAQSFGSVIARPFTDVEVT